MIIILILIYLIALAAYFLLPLEVRSNMSIGLLVVGIVATVFVFMLAIKLHRTGVGVLLGILTLIPVVGLIVLLVINRKATAVLRAHGVAVGFLGARGPIP